MEYRSSHRNIFGYLSTILNIHANHINAGSLTKKASDRIKLKVK